MSHTSIRFFDIQEMTMPQVEAIMERLGKHICIKAGVPYEGESESKEPEEEHTIEEALRFVAQFQKR